MHVNPKSMLLALLCVASMLGALGCSSSSSTPTYFDYCEPSIPPAECYAERRDPDSDQVMLATDIARRYMNEHPPEMELWDWTSGVLMFALTELYRVTGDTEVRRYYEAYLDHHIDVGYDLFWSDSCPPALTALALLREEDNPDYRQVVEDVLNYLQTVPRTADGGINHLGPDLAEAPWLAIWIDSLFMFGMVLNRHGEAAEDAAALALMSEQLGIFSDVLQDEAGLFVHADSWATPFDTDIYWGRGNGWVTASLADYLRIRFLRNERDEDADRMFRNQVASVIATQDTETGLWWTVLNRPGEGDNYQETSAAALFAYGIARAYRYDILGDEELAVAKDAVEAVKGAVDTDELDRPFVTNISVGTNPETFEGYVSVAVEDDVSYGVGAVILALIETSGL